MKKEEEKVNDISLPRIELKFNCFCMQCGEDFHSKFEWKFPSLKIYHLVVKGVPNKQSKMGNKTIRGTTVTTKNNKQPANKELTK